MSGDPSCRVTSPRGEDVTLSDSAAEQKRKKEKSLHVSVCKTEILVEQIELSNTCHIQQPE